MKKSILLICSVIVALMGYSCSSDDNSPEEGSLFGEWQLEAIDFSFINEEAFEGKPHPVYRTDFCVMEYIAGYTFNDDKEKSFIFIVTEDMFGTNSGLSSSNEPIWYWEGGLKDFTISQPNPMHTNNYVFAPKKITNRKIVKVGDQWELTFDAELHLGSKGTFTFVKKEINKTSHRPKLTHNGKHKDTCKLLDR